MKHKCSFNLSFLTRASWALLRSASVDVLLAMLGFAATLPSERCRRHGCPITAPDCLRTLRPALYRLMAGEAGPDYRVDKSGCATLPGSSLRASFVQGARFRCAGAPTVDLYLALTGVAQRCVP